MVGLGHMVAGNTQIPQLFQAAPSGHHIHGSPVYWNGPGGPLVYVWAEQDVLKAFAFGTSTFNTTPLSQSTFAAPAGMPAGFLSLSSNGSAAGTGILWAALPLSQDANLQVAPGVLRAFDASDLTNQIWNSETNCSDQVGAFAKYVAPTVVNGKVYLVTFSNQLLVYGFLSSLPAANSGLIGSVRCDGSNVNLTTVGTADWAQWPNFNHKASGGAQISNYTVVGTGTVQTSTYARTIAWTDGRPTASGSTQSGVFVSGRGNGFQLSAPADTNTRTLYLYVSGNNSAGRLVAHLSDGSAPDYVNALSGVGSYDVVYTLTYNARSANQQLIVKWVQASDPGTVTLRAAALVDATSALPLPPTNVSASDGTSPTSVTVSWTGSANATNYTVYRSTTSGSLGSSIGATNTTTLTDSTPVPGTQYYYSVVASGASGNSAPSAQASGHAGSLSGSVATSFAGLATGIANATSQTSTMTTTAAAIGGALGGSSTTSSATVNITAAGTSDWVKWPNSIRKATGNNQISTLVTAGTTAAQTYTNDQRSVAWSDGTPTASGSDQSGLYVSGLGTGFQITAPADTTTRTLSFYVGGSNSGGALIAHLSDGSAPDYVSTTAPVTGQYDIGYTITYRAASAGSLVTANVSAAPAAKLSPAPQMSTGLATALVGDQDSPPGVTSRTPLAPCVTSSSSDSM
jgi:hypothetical protein